jgi:hypothetical protein
LFKRSHHAGKSRSRHLLRGFPSSVSLLESADVAFVPLLAWTGCRFLLGKTGAMGFELPVAQERKK